MIFYLVKEVSTATAENKSFAGQKHTGIYGKGDKLLAYDGDPWLNRKLDSYHIKEYGYTRKCDAVRNWTYKNPENSKYWKSAVEIVACVV